MVAVVEHQVADVLLPPLVPVTAVAVAHLGLLPAVETLSHDHHAQAVADFHLHRRGHVVAGADGIGAHGLHHLDLADKGGLIDSGTQWTQIVMQAHAFNLAALAVELETAFLAERDSADTHLLRLTVNLQSLVAQCRRGCVQVRILGRPQRGQIHLERHSEMPHPIRACFSASHRSSHSIQEGELQFKVIIDHSCRIQLMLNPQSRLLPVDAQSADVESPCVKGILLAGHHQFHGTIDACARIPSVALLLVLQTHFQRV